MTQNLLADNVTLRVHNSRVEGSTNVVSVCGVYVLVRSMQHTDGVHSLHKKAFTDVKCVYINSTRR